MNQLRELDRSEMARVEGGNHLSGHHTFFTALLEGLVAFFQSILGALGGGGGGGPY
jgi:hypothetical protein